MAWEYAKGTGYVLSNILYGDYVYLLTDNGVVTCLDAETGAVQYEGGTAAGALALHGIAGRVRRIHRDDERRRRDVHAEGRSHHEIVRTNTVDEPVYSSPAIANGRIYIRGEKHLFAIGEAKP